MFQYGSDAAKKGAQLIRVGAEGGGCGNGLVFFREFLRQGVELSFQLADLVEKVFWGFGTAGLGP